MKIAGLFVYPVKSMRGVAVDRADLDEEGLVGDRRWMVVGTDGRFLTQRSHPQLATFEARLAGKGLVISHEAASIAVAVEAAQTAREVTVWKSTLPALDAGNEVALWLSARLGVECRLVRFSDAAKREANPQYAKDTVVAFQDAYPVLVTNTASLEDLNRRLTVPVSMDRFRPNVVVQSDKPWDEDEWKRVELGAVSGDVVKPCDRCIVTTTDQRTGQRQGVEPLATLKGFHNHPQLGPIFGMNVVHRVKGTLHLGDPVAAHHHSRERMVYDEGFLTPQER